MPFYDSSVGDYEVAKAVLTIELKTGVIAVSGPEANRQLHDYLVGESVRHPKAETFYGLILQPSIVDELAFRMGRWTRDEVVGVGFSGGQPPLLVQLAKIRKATHDPNAPLIWGEHCGHCRCREMCPARRGTVQQARATLAVSGSTVAEYMQRLDPATRLTEWETAKEAKRYLEKFDELVKAWLLADPNAQVPGYRIGPKAGNRQFLKGRPAPEVAAEVFEKVKAELEAAKIDSPAKLLEVISPTKIEEAVGKKAYARLTDAGLVEKAEASLAVLKDARPAIPQPRAKA